MAERYGMAMHILAREFRLIKVNPYTVNLQERKNIKEVIINKP